MIVTPRALKPSRPLASILQLPNVSGWLISSERPGRLCGPAGASDTIVYEGEDCSACLGRQRRPCNENALQVCIDGVCRRPSIDASALYSLQQGQRLRGHISTSGLYQSSCHPLPLVHVVEGST